MLLIDEIDRADDDFEAFLLELLADAAVTIPEIGTIRATHPPVIVLTSNRTRDLHDAVKRRCLYHWIDYPSPQREVEIVRRRVKAASEALAVQVADAVARIRDSDVQKPPGVAEAIDWLAALNLLHVERLDAAAVDRTLGSVLKYSEDQEVVRAAGLEQLVGRVDELAVADRVLSVQTIHLDLPAVVGAFSRRLREAGVPMTAERAARFAQALTLVKPVTRRRLYWTARAVLVSDSSNVKAFDSVFFSVFGPQDLAPSATSSSSTSGRSRRRHTTARRLSTGRLHSALGRPARGRATCPPPRPIRATERELGEVAVPMGPSDEELLRAKRFEALDPEELAQLYRLMTRLQVSTPRRRMRRSESGRRGERIDLRRTLRGSMRTAGDPIRLARRHRRVVRRRMVMLCDISGSMEPYARAYLQFLTCAAGSGPNAEAFVFATRLTRLTRALARATPSERSSAQRRLHPTGRAGPGSATL